MIKAIIIDDEKPSRETLRALLSRYCESVVISAEADGYNSAITAIKKEKPDVVFLDIQMPDGSGFKLLESIEEINFEVIFTTAFEQYAIKAIRYSALDYLLKPIVPDELIAAIHKLNKKKIEGQLHNPNIKLLLENVKKQNIENKKIVLSVAEGMHVIEVKNIIRLESDDYYTRFFFSNGKKLLVSKTLKEHEELLEDYNFIRPHKSHLLNAAYIKCFNKQEGGYIEMTDGTMIPVSRRKREYILDLISHM
jgi:two-component system, LytTR family, response regulator